MMATQYFLRVNECGGIGHLTWHSSPGYYLETSKIYGPAMRGVQNDELREVVPEEPVATPVAGRPMVHADGIYISGLRKTFSIRRRELVALDNVDLEAAHGLFSMSPGDIAANVATLKFAQSQGVATYYTNPNLFDGSILKQAEAEVAAAK